jgi:predicted small secreted protein
MIVVIKGSGLLGWKKFLLGVTVGAASAVLVHSQLNKEFISAEKALKFVKEAFKKEGPIEGSWINTERESYENNNVIYQVYRGGVSKKTDGVLTHYQFVVNAKNGTFIEVIKEES